MKPLRLLPPVCRWIGLVLFLVGVLIWLLPYAIEHWDDRMSESLGFDIGELVFPLGVGGSALMAFASQRVEDELVQNFRLRALHWALVAHLLVVVVVYFIPFPEDNIENGFLKLELTILQMGGLFLIYLSRFHYLLARTRRLEREEAA